MATGRQKQIRELFEGALDRPPETRDEYLRLACGGDNQLFFDVGKLLAARERSGGVLDTPVQRREENSAPPPQIGSQIGPYKILSQLGEGGMGVVYQVLRADGVFDRVSALKVIRPEFARPHLIEKFRQERSILALLDHPHVARIVDGGSTAEGLPYFVADFVDGMSIDRFCTQHGLTIRQRVAIFQQVCEATHYLHIHNVIHCDLKPPNILVTPDGVVKLVDFGIASLWIEGSSPNPSVPIPLMTRDYASPEQRRGERLTPASDIYSLGIVLYELLTHTRPADAGSQTSAEASEPAIAAADRVPRSNPGVANELRGDLDAIVQRAIHPNPKARYRTAADFGRDIGSYLNGGAVAARNGGAPYRIALAIRRNARALQVTLLILALLGVNVWQAFVMRERDVYRHKMETKVAKLEQQIRDTAVQMAESAKSSSVAGQPQSPPIPAEAQDIQMGNLVSLRDAYRTSFSEAIRVWPGMTQSRKHLIDNGRDYLRLAEPLLAGRTGAREALAEAWLTLADIQGNPANPNLHDTTGAVDSLREAARIAAESSGASVQQLLDRANKLRSVLGGK